MLAAKIISKLNKTILPDIRIIFTCFSFYFSLHLHLEWAHAIRNGRVLDFVPLQVLSSLNSFVYFKLVKVPIVACYRLLIYFNRFVP